MIDLKISASILWECTDHAIVVTANDHVCIIVPIASKCLAMSATAIASAQPMSLPSHFQPSFNFHKSHWSPKYNPMPQGVDASHQTSMSTADPEEWGCMEFQDAAEKRARTPCQTGWSEEPSGIYVHFQKKRRRQEGLASKLFQKDEQSRYVWEFHWHFEWIFCPLWCSILGDWWMRRPLKDIWDFYCSGGRRNSFEDPRWIQGRWL